MIFFLAIVKSERFRPSHGLKQSGFNNKVVPSSNFMCIICGIDFEIIRQNMVECVTGDIRV